MNDYVEMKKWRRLALLSFGGLVLVSAFAIYQGIMIKAQREWMIKAYMDLQVCSELLSRGTSKI
jgi:predicted transporter